jgi:hypothetical protein
MSDQAICPDWFESIEQGRRGAPVLVLALWPNSARHVGKFEPEALKARDWSRIHHQTAGVCCHQRTFWATRLEPRSSVIIGMNTIEARWFGTDLGRGPWLNAIAEYEASIRNFFGEDITCNRSYDLLEEGIYPIDLTRRALGRLTDDTLSDLPHIAQDEGAHLWIHDKAGTLRLLILGANSD